MGSGMMLKLLVGHTGGLGLTIVGWLEMVAYIHCCAAVYIINMC